MILVIPEGTIDVRPIKDGLRRLSELAPTEAPHVHAFGGMLADYLNDRIYPSSIRLTVSLLMHDVARGASGYHSVAFPKELRGLPPVVAAALELSIPWILRAAGGQEHADIADRLAGALRGDAWSDE